MTMTTEAPMPAPAAPPPEAPAEEQAAAPDAAEGEQAAPAEGDGAVPAEGEAGVAPAEPTPEQAPALFRRALKERERVLAERNKVEHEKQRLRHEREQFARERAELEAWKAKKAKIDADPYALFDEFEIDRNDFARRLMNESDPMAKQLAEERRARIELQKQVEDEKQQRETSEVNARVAVAKRNFIGFVAQRAGDFPDLADADEGDVADVFWSLAAEHHRNTEQIPTFEMVARHMQQQEDARRAKREERRRLRLGAQPTANPSGGKPAPLRTAPTGQSAKGPGPRTTSTLTNSDASVRASAPREDAKEDVDEWALKELRRAMRVDTSS